MGLFSSENVLLPSELSLALYNFESIINWTLSVPVINTTSHTRGLKWSFFTGWEKIVSGLVAGPTKRRICLGFRVYTCGVPVLSLCTLRKINDSKYQKLQIFTSIYTIFR